MPAQSAPPPSSLTLEEYASVAARLLQAAGKPADIVLAELDIPADVWQAAAAAWERALDEELARGGSTLLTTFAARFVATRTAIGRRSISAPALRAEPAPVTQRERAEPAPVTQRERAAPAPVTQPERAAPAPITQPERAAPAPITQPERAEPAPVTQPERAEPAPVTRRERAEPAPITRREPALERAGLPEVPALPVDPRSLSPAPEPDPVQPLVPLEPPPPSWLQRLRRWLRRRSARP